MQKDGNCFFRCISSYLHNTDVYHENIRHEVRNALSKNKDFYSQLIDGDFDQHTNNMEQTNGNTDTWATEAEIMAASETFNCEIFIKTIVDGNFSWIRHSIKPNCDHDIPYISILHANQHFSLIINNVRPCQCNNQNIVNNKQRKDNIQKEVYSNSDFSEQCEIFNKSSIILTTSQKSLLSKGFKFVPSRRTVDIGKLIPDIKTWERRMRLREYFFDDKDQDQDQDQEYSKFKKSSDWTPISGRDRWLDMYVEQVRDDIIKGLGKDFKLNITNNEGKTLREFLHDDYIVIQPSDKSSCVVIMNRSDYETGVCDELKDNGTYKEIKEDF